MMQAINWPASSLVCSAPIFARTTRPNRSRATQVGSALRLLSLHLRRQDDSCVFWRKIQTRDWRLFAIVPDSRVWPKEAHAPRPLDSLKCLGSRQSRAHWANPKCATPFHCLVQVSYCRQKKDRLMALATVSCARSFILKLSPSSVRQWRLCSGELLGATRIGARLSEAIGGGQESKINGQFELLSWTTRGPSSKVAATH